ncbi:hypothetical protein C2S53_016440 [Perilla frutescens var. hirtella]|uniref:Uncharacterized protein n=1 Tax=Perilla frutescens var. hirtella TaxID=608512 RepID=A0AAD4J666_PERFH|nr:hypothetical protein C2S53_016440 [Perilla frutescens var. hirtella]
MELPERVWRSKERESLVNLLVEAAYRVDLGNTYVMGYFLLGASSELSAEFGKLISREDILSEMESLKDRLLNFLWFTSLNGVFYDEALNEVYVSPEYYAAFEKGEEPRRKRKYRIFGEPMYKDLKAIFFYGRADVADWDWLTRSFNGGEGVFLSADQSWPMSNPGIAAGYGPSGPTFRVRG